MSDPVVPDPLRAGLEALMVYLNSLRPVFHAVSNGPGKHRRARERREVETIHKTLNVVEAEVAALLRRVPPAAPETAAPGSICLTCGGFGVEPERERDERGGHKVFTR